MTGTVRKTEYGFMCCRMLFSRARKMAGAFGCLLRPDQR